MTINPANEGESVSFESIETVDAIVENRFDPLRQDGFVSENFFHSLDRVQSSSSGGGGTGIKSGLPFVQCGSTAGGHGEFVTRVGASYRHHTTLSWDVTRVFAATVDFEDIGENIFIGVGDNLSSSSSQRVGFYHQNSDDSLYGHVHNGSSATQSQITGSPSTGVHRLFCEFNPGDNARFWWDADPSDSPDVELTSGLPSGTAEANRLMTIWVDTPDGVKIQLRPSMFRTVVYP